MKRRILAMLLCVVLVLSVAACGAKTGTPPDASGTVTSPGSEASTPAIASDSAQAKDTLNVAITADDGTLAIEYMTAGVYSAMAVVMEPLWDVNENGDVIWTLAESVDQPSDSEMTVHLRKDVTFSNGNPFTAEDVIFSLGLYKQAGATGQPRTQTIDPEKTTIIDDYTIDLQMFEPSVAQWQILSQFFIYDKESYDPETVSTKPIGTGPYVLTEYTPNSSAKLERNESYWGTKPDFKYINFSVLAEPSRESTHWRPALLTSRLSPLRTLSTSTVWPISALTAVSRAITSALALTSARSRSSRITLTHVKQSFTQYSRTLSQTLSI